MTIFIGNEAGPFFIHCKENIFSVKKVYWQAVDNGTSPIEIHGTTDDKKASTFYVKYVNKSHPQFYIIYRPEQPTQPTQPLYVVVKKPFSAKCPLMLVPNAHYREISFTMVAAVKSKDEVLKLPNTTNNWTCQNPVFLRLPCGRYPDSWIRRWKHYVRMHKEGDTYRTVSSTKNAHTSMHNFMMLFSFENALEMKRTRVRAGIPYVIPDDMEDENEPINWFDGDELENDNASFYELVGEDYVLPS